MRLTLLLLLASLVPANVGGQEPARGPRVVGYFPSWAGYGKQYSVADIPAAQLSHVIYAFARIDPGGEIVVGDEKLDLKGIDGRTPQFQQVRALSRRHPGLKTLISVGGWTWSECFSDVAATDKSRTRFAKSAVRFLSSHGFDGIDIDWEFPVRGGDKDNKHRAADKQNFTLLLAELRKQFRAARKPWLITCAVGVIPSHYENLELAELATHADWLNLMAYNMHGNWSSVTNFHTALRAAEADPNKPPVKDHANVDAAVRAYLKAGVPANKIVVGGAMYGRTFRGVSRNNDGLFQKFDSKSKQPTGIPYRRVKSLIGKGWTRHWHKQACVPWLFNEKERTLIAYDDEQSLIEKARFVRDRKLGGMMLWSLSSDDSDHTLVKAVSRVLRVPLDKEKQSP